MRPMWRGTFQTSLDLARELAALPSTVPACGLAGAALANAAEASGPMRRIRVIHAAWTWLTRLSEQIFKDWHTAPDPHWPSAHQFMARAHIDWGNNALAGQHLEASGGEPLEFWGCQEEGLSASEAFQQAREKYC